MKFYKKASDIRVGVVGYGGAYNMGNSHIKGMQAAGMTPLAVAEPVAERLDVAAKDFPGIETYSSVSEMLTKSNVDLVTIITPHNTHAPLALECLRVGRHVVCEKPLAVTTAEVDAMIRAAKKSGVMISAYHNRHWDGRILQALRIVRKEKAIGDIYRIGCHMAWHHRPGDSWRSSKTISGGILYDWGVHLLEYSLQLIDSPICEVSGFKHEGFWAPKTKWKKDCVEDDAMFAVRFASGQRLTLQMSNIETIPADGWVEVVGTKGSFILGGGNSTLRTLNEKGEVETKQLDNPPDEHGKYYENIAKYLTGKSKLIITGEWARRPIHILDLAVRSAIENRTLKAKYC